MGNWQSDLNKFDIVEFGKCPTIHQIGAGTQGTVYQVNHKLIGKLAFKKFHKTNPRNLNEIKYLQKFSSHPNIVGFSGCILEKKQIIGFAMELLGADLDKIIYNPMEVYTYVHILSWGSQLALALSWLHSKNHVHDDVRPKNMLISNSKEVLKLSGFAVDRAERKEPYSELWAESCEKASDVYSAGIVFWEMAARSKPNRPFDTFCVARPTIFPDTDPPESDVSFEPWRDLIKQCICFESDRRSTMDRVVSSEIEKMPYRFTPPQNVITYVDKSSYKAPKAVEDEDISEFVYSDFTNIKHEDVGVEGTVERVQHSRIRSDVAVKRHKSSDAHSTVSQNVKKEYEILKKLDHPNIIKVFGLVVNEDREAIGFVMEYMLGKTLHNAIQESINQVSCYLLNAQLSWAQQAAAALVYLHENQLIHRDIKPKNMVFSGDRKILKLCDFGRSRIKVETSMTYCAGTVCYMAPETMNDDKEKGRYTDKCDIYSIGITMWEMGNREHPFAGIGDWDLFQMIKLGERPQLEGGPECTEELIQRCISIDPAERPSSLELLEELNKILEAELDRMNEMMPKVEMNYF